MPRTDRRELGRLLVVATVSLALASLAIGLLEDVIGVPSAAIVYLAAVVAAAFFAGTAGAIVTATASFLLYDFLFVEPRYTFTVSAPVEWLNLVLLLFVGVVVGQLVALQRARTRVAEAREREARAMFQVSRELATRESTPAVLPTIAQILNRETGSIRTWVALGEDDARERLAADAERLATGGAAGAGSGAGSGAFATRTPSPGAATPSGGPAVVPAGRPFVPGLHHVLQRMPGDEPAHWIRVHLPGQPRTRPTTRNDVYRVRIEAGGRAFGSIWSLRDRDQRAPDETGTRLLSAAADQVGQALASDRLAAESRAAEIARQSDALKSALLQSVSHDLRTPLATIRAAAGTLRPGSGLSAVDQMESAEAIDREVEYLNRLVTNLLDLSRIEAGALRADRDLFELDDLVGRTLDRLAPRLADRKLEVELEAPPVDVDPVFLDEALTNALENAIKYTPAGTTIRLTAEPLPGEPWVRLTVEDAGPGVPDKALPRLFEKFYRVPGSPGGSRSGTGIGLAVVLGLVEAMGGRVGARRSELGGLAIDMDLPIATVVSPLDDRVLT